MKQLSITTAFFLFMTMAGMAQSNSTVDLVNEVVANLIGEQDVEDIPVYKSIRQICNSSYFSCNQKNKIIGLNFQFSNLNGVIPPSLTKLKQLEWINLEYNYLAGPIPEGLSNLKNLEELLLNGNFLTGPLPADLLPLGNDVLVDLSQNVIDLSDNRVIERLNIIDQVNLEGCRSPDSIFISKKANPRAFYQKDADISIDVDGIKIEELIDTTNHKEGDEFKVVESMPRFPGCEDMAEEKERDGCAQEKMLQYIYKNLRYPELARENGVEGMVVLQFVVVRNGAIADVRIVRNPGVKLGNSGQWIINRMNYLCDPWTPGIQRGQPVKVLYTLPIKFKLE